MGNKGSKDTDIPQPILPLDIIMEILSWLPLMSLAQVQLVCKAWQELIHDHHFIVKHMNHNKLVWYWHNVPVPSTRQSTSPERDSYSYIHGCDGLILLKNNTTRKYCLWNPAIRGVLELPDPHGHNDGFALSFVPSVKSYRILAFYRDEESGAEFCEVFTPGYSKDWRRLKLPDTNAHGRRKTESVSIVSVEGVVHCVLLLKNDKEIVHEIVSLDLETEHFTVNHLPKGVFEGYETVWDLDWNGKLAFAVITEQTIEVMELQNYKKGNWCPKKAIHLKFLEKNNYRPENLFPLFVTNGDIWFWLKKEKVFTYTIESGQIANVKRSETFALENKLYVYKPTLITFEGMQSDTHMERLRPPMFE